jgi:hypothetical protein
MEPRPLVRLCRNVESLAYTLDELDASGRGDGATAVLLRMEFAALTTELIAAGLVERARRESAVS